MKIELCTSNYSEDIRIYPEGEEALQGKVAEIMKSLGCVIEVLRLHPTTVQLNKEFIKEEAVDMTRRVHVIGKIPGSSDGRSLMLITHPDADSINPESWSKPLHEGVIEDGRMYGWAAADDLTGLCMMFEASSVEGGRLQARRRSVPNERVGQTKRMGHSRPPEGRVYS